MHSSTAGLGFVGLGEVLFHKRARPSAVSYSATTPSMHMHAHLQLSPDAKAGILGFGDLGPELLDLGTC